MSKGEEGATSTGGIQWNQAVRTEVRSGFSLHDPVWAPTKKEYGALTNWGKTAPLLPEYVQGSGVTNMTAGEVYFNAYLRPLSSVLQDTWANAPPRQKVYRRVSQDDFFFGPNGVQWARHLKNPDFVFQDGTQNINSQFLKELGIIQVGWLLD